MIDNPFYIPDEILDAIIAKMTPEEQVVAASRVASDYFTLTGQPLIVGETFMAACRDAGVDTAHLLVAQPLPT